MRRILYIILIVIPVLFTGCNKGNVSNYLVNKIVTFFVGNNSNKNVEQGNIATNGISNSILQKNNDTDSIEVGDNEEDTISIDSLLKGVQLPFKVETYVFKSANKRDIFEPLLSKSKTSEALNLDNSILTGIVTGPNGRVALIKEFGGQGFVLRENDKIANGFVKEIGNDYIIFETHQFGFVSKTTFKLESEDQKLKF